MIRISYIYIASILIVIWAIYRIIVLMKSKGKKYIEEIKPSEYFIVTFPSFEVIENSDIYNLYNGQESKNLKIRFLDSNGNEYNEMKLAK
ncbi:hypothetical protein [Clostridium paraputrificum]|uniref:Uncharacterized protein n=1 Tax=Clostridium paraputrificum TaxID=29363 RepID=A0A6N3EG02_9CLOT